MPYFRIVIFAPIIEPLRHETKKKKLLLAASEKKEWDDFYISALDVLASGMNKYLMKDVLLTAAEGK